MKTSIMIFALCLVTNAFAQITPNETSWRDGQFADNDLYPDEYKASFLKYDFDSLWTSDYVLGFIGPNYERLHLKIISVTKDADHPDSYRVTGRSIVKKNICDFKGTITITNVRVYRKMHWGVDDEYKGKGIKQEGILVGEYYFAEDRSQSVQVDSMEYSALVGS